MSTGDTQPPESEDTIEHRMQLMQRAMGYAITDETRPRYPNATASQMPSGYSAAKPYFIEVSYFPSHMSFKQSQNGCCDQGMQATSNWYASVADAIQQVMGRQPAAVFNAIAFIYRMPKGDEHANT